LAFGVAMGAIKGNATGLRAGVGNLSAPWLLVALLPGLRSGTVLRGCLIGAVNTMVALVGFYATLTVALAGHLGGGGYAAEFAVELEANHVYFVAGIVSGPLLGALGAWLGSRHSNWSWWVIGGIVACEAAAVALVQGHQLAPAPFYFAWGLSDWRPYIAESVLGVAILVATAFRRRSKALAS
jgi:hypothetical protein